MATRSRMKSFKKGYHNVDDVFRMLTGKRLKTVAGKAASIFGEAVVKKMTESFTGLPASAPAENSPYDILGIHPDAMDVVVKASFRALAKEYHPDTGLKPDPARFQQAQEAYNAIVKEREFLRSAGVKE